MRRILLLLALSLLACRTALAAPADNPSVINALRQANALERMEHYDAALNTINSAIKIDPAYLPLWRERALILLSQHNLAEATTSIKQVLRINPDDSEANLILFRILAGAPPELAAREGLSLKRLLDGIQDAGLSTILTYLLENSQQKDLLQRFVANFDPPSPQRQVIAATMRAFAAGDYPTAEATLVSDKTLSQNQGKELARLLYLIGVGYRDTVRYDDALRAFGEARDLGHDPIETQGEIGWVYRKKGDPAKALGLWAASWREAANPGDWTLWIADAAMDAKDYPKAMEFYGRALGFRPKDPLLQGKYYCALLLGNPDKAAAYGSKLRDAGNRDGEQYGLALYETERGNPDAALAALLQIRDRKVFQEPLRAFARDLAVQPADRTRLEKRAADIMALLENDPAKASIARDLGWTLWNGGSPGQALALWQTALDAGLPEAQPLKRQIVLRLLESGQTAQAIVFLAHSLPLVKPLGLARSLMDRSQFDAARMLLAKAGPTGDGGWTDLLLALCTLRTGEPAAALDLLTKVSRLQALPDRQETVFDDRSHLTEQAFNQAYALTLYRQIAQTIVDQDTDDAFFFLNKQPWLPGLPPRVVAQYQAEAGAGALRAGRPEQGKTLCDAALAMDPGNALATVYARLAAGPTALQPEAAGRFEAALA